MFRGLPTASGALSELCALNVRWSRDGFARPYGGENAVPVRQGAATTAPVPRGFWRGRPAPSHVLCRAKFRAGSGVHGGASLLVLPVLRHGVADVAIKRWDQIP